MPNKSFLRTIFSTSSFISGLVALSATPALSIDISTGATNLGTITGEVIETGTLGSGELASFSFSLDDPTFLEITSNGSDFDTELGLYDSSGNLIESDDDGGEGLRSFIPQSFDAGDFFASLGGYNTSFDENFEVTPGTSNGDFQLTFTPDTGPENIDLGAIRDGKSTTGDLGTGEIVFFSFSINEPFTFLDITSNASDFDTEIGLYNSSGNLIESDDDDGDGLQSTLSFGTGGDFGTGQDGDLDAGTFFLALGEYNTSFNDRWSAFSSASSEDEDEGGSFQITFSTDATPIPESSTSLGILVLGGILVGTRLNKNRNRQV